MVESSGWPGSPKQPSPQFEHLGSVIRRFSTFLSIFDWCKAATIIPDHGRKNLLGSLGTFAASSSVQAASVLIRLRFWRGLENESELLGWRHQKPQSPLLAIASEHGIPPVLIDQSQSRPMDYVSSFERPRRMTKWRLRFLVTSSAQLRIDF